MYTNKLPKTNAIIVYCKHALIQFFNLKNNNKIKNKVTVASVGKPRQGSAIFHNSVSGHPYA